MIPWQSKQLFILFGLQHNTALYSLESCSEYLSLILLIFSKGFLKVKFIS